MQQQQPQHTMSVAIIGAGFSGICMGIQLQRAGFTDFTIFEAAHDIGGTWRDNSYPGCTCDIPSVLYSYSFEPYPWSEHYSSQQQIHKYQQYCVDKYGLREHIKLGAKVTEAVYDDSSGMWVVTTATGEQTSVRLLVLAQGGLSIPSLPSIPGLSSFQGRVFHSARWDHAYDLKGKRVAVVGTGASAIQIIPQIQPLVKQLYVIQRTPPWVMPRAATFPAWAAVGSECSAVFMWLQRLRFFWFNELILGTSMTRNKREVLKKLEALSKWHLRQQVSDVELRAKLTPTYSLGCKRVLPSDMYYPALCQSNVQLVASGLKEIQGGTTIIAEDGTSADVDAIIFATGFDLLDTLQGMTITGREGCELVQALRSKTQTFLGMASPGFPNLFMINGPNTGLGHNSMIFMMECAVNFIVKMLQWMAAKKLASVEVQEEVHQRFNDEVQQRLKGTVWLGGGCSSWYQDGKGSSAVLWPGLCVEYWWRTAWPKARDWKVVSVARTGGRSARLGMVGTAAAAAAAAAAVLLVGVAVGLPRSSSS